MTTDNLCATALAERGDHLCQLMLREEKIPGELWSWSVYIDGSVHRRGPGSTRIDPLKWYATLPQGEHRIVVREEDHTKKDRQESNTLHFVVKEELEIIVKAAFVEGAIVLSLEK
ncbi:hypothetical protein GCM10007918_17210 [Piscinibacter gummiphilus]|nr:hypothetical protein GCM10007918_17210 [Piscinibacter gummiphilus]